VIRGRAALTPCPSPLAKSAPGEGRVLNFPLGIVKDFPLSRSAFCEGRRESSKFSPRNSKGLSPLPERFLRGEKGEF